MVGTPSPVRRLRPAARREQLLDATSGLVAEVGFGGVSVELVARRAGITRAVIYRHFADLPALLEATVEREMGRALEQLAASQLTDLTAGDPVEQLARSLAAHLATVRDHPTTWRLVMMPPAGAPELLRRSIDQGRGSVLASMTRAVRPLLEASGGGDVELTARVMQAVSDEYARLVLVDPVRYPTDRIVAHLQWLLGRALV